MFDSIFDLFIILIPVAIVIGRFATRLKNKRNPPPKPPQPYIPIHFEDDEDDSDYVYTPKPAEEIPKKALSPIQPAFLAAKLESLERAYEQTRLEQVQTKLVHTELAPLAHNTALEPVKAVAAARPAVKLPAVTASVPVESSGSGFLNINKLSPLKQAVVMAEVLGPPKSLQ